MLLTYSLSVCDVYISRSLEVLAQWRYPCSGLLHRQPFNIQWFATLQGTRLIYYVVHQSRHACEVCFLFALESQKGYKITFVFHATFEFTSFLEAFINSSTGAGYRIAWRINLFHICAKSKK